MKSDSDFKRKLDAIMNEPLDQHPIAFGVFFFVVLAIFLLIYALAGGGFIWVG